LHGRRMGGSSGKTGYRCRFPKKYGRKRVFGGNGKIYYTEYGRAGQNAGAWRDRSQRIGRNRMQQEIFEVEKDRFDLKDPSIYRLQGCWPKGCEACAMLDGLQLDVEMGDQERISALERFQDLDKIHGMRVQMSIHLPED